MQEVGVRDSQTFPTSFQSFLGNSGNKTNLVKQLFLKWRGTLPKVLTFFQTNYLANLDGATYRVTSQRSEKIDFYCNHEEADSKMFAYIKFLYDNICLNCLNRITLSPDSDIAVISLYQSVSNWNRWRYIPIPALALGIPVCCLLGAMHVGCESISSFSHIRKITTFQTLKNKMDQLTNMIDFDGFSHSLCSVCCYFMKKINQVQVWLNYDIECLPKRIWAEIVRHQL